jgi:O-antigen ligase
VYLLDIWLEVPGTRTYGTHTAGQGVFYHHIAQGMVLSFLGAYALHRGWYYKDQPTRRWFWWTVSAVTAAGLLTVGQSRTAQVSVIAAYAIVALVHYSGRKGFLAITAFAIISAALIAASPKTHDRLILGWQEASSFQHNGEHTSVGARLKAWEFSWQQFKQSPWLGHGIGSYRERAYAHFQDSPICRLGVCDQPHNQFVLSTFEMGVLGLVAWPGLLCVLLLSGPSSYKVQLRGGCAAFITVVVTTAMFDSSLNIQAQLFFIVMAFTLLGMQPSQSIPK